MHRAAYVIVVVALGIFGMDDYDHDRPIERNSLNEKVREQCDCCSISETIAILLTGVYC